MINYYKREWIPTIVLAHQPAAAAEAIEWEDVRLGRSGMANNGHF